MIHLLFVVFFSFEGFAAPIVFQCNKNKNLTDIVFSPSLLKKQNQFVKQLLTSTTEAAVCDNNCSLACEKLKSQNLLIVEASLKKLLDSKKSEIVISVDSDAFNGFKKSHQDQISQFQCENETLIDPDQFINSGDLTTFYPYQNNWMFLSGCKSMSLKSCQQTNWKSTKEKIREAVSMGMDPYVFLAKGYLENGISGAQDLYLDPVGAMDSIGCKGTPSNKEVPGVTLNSFDTFYEFKPQVITNTKLTQKLENYLKLKNFEYEKKPAHLCRHILHANPTISESKIDGECCLKIPFTAQDSDELIETLEDALTIEQASKTIKSKFRNQTDPAYRIQRFNGFTDLMGAAEPVPAFRAGINFFKTPAYGYQGMDFLLNSLMINPAIQKEVELAKKAYGDYQSLLCMDRTEGQYAIDSEKYFELHKNSPRMEVIAGKLAADPNYKLTERETKVMRIELDNTNVFTQIEGSEKLRNLPKQRDLIFQLKAMGVTTENYALLEKEKIIKNIQEKSSEKLSQEEIEKAVSLIQQLDPISREYDKWSNQLGLDSYKKLLVFLQKSEIYEISNSEDLEDLKYSKIEKLLNDKQKMKFQNELSYLKFIEQEDELKEEIATLLNIDHWQVHNIMYLTQEAAETLRNNPNNQAVFKENPKALEVFNLYAAEMQKTDELTITPALLKNYFEKIYPKRKTTSTASTYEWRKLTDQELEKIANQLKAEQLEFLELTK